MGRAVTSLVSTTRAGRSLFLSVYVLYSNECTPPLHQKTGVIGASKHLSFPHRHEVWRSGNAASLEGEERCSLDRSLGIVLSVVEIWLEFGNRLLRMNDEIHKNLFGALCGAMVTMVVRYM